MSQNPYAPPQHYAQSASYTPSFKSLQTLTNVITIGLAVISLCAVVMSAMETIGALIFPDFTNPMAEASSEQEVTFIFAGLGVSLAYLVVYIVLVVAVSMLAFRANNNVRALGAKGLAYSPGWCAGYWFIPIVNLFRPYQSMKEIYKASCQPVGTQWKSVPSLGVFPFWWAAWLIGGFVAQIEFRLAMRGVDLGMGGVAMNWTSTILITAAAMLLIVIVRAINDQQTSWYTKSKPGYGDTANPVGTFANR